MDGMKNDTHDATPTFHIFGDTDTCLAHPVRISESGEKGDGERLWATLAISDAPRLRSFVAKTLGDRQTAKRGVYETSAQHFIERLKDALNEGELAECDFSLVVIGWPFENAETTFARSFRRA